MHTPSIAVITPIEDGIPVQVSAYKAWMPRYGSVSVAQALKDAGYEVRHYCEHSGSVIDWEWVFSCDYVGLSLMTFCARKGAQYARRIREHSKARIIAGGCHASVAPEDCLDFADIAVRNEGEAALLEVLDALGHGGDLSGVQGISYRDGFGQIRHNPDHAFIADLSRVVDISLIDGYPRNDPRRFLKEAFRRRQIPRISLPVAQTSRGCVHRCRFCMVKFELGSTYRRRPPEVVVQEIEKAFDHLRSRTIFLVDNDFTHDTDHALAVLTPLVEKYGGRFNIYFFSRIDLAKKPRLLEVLRTIDNVYIGVGFESTNDSTLSEFSKGQRHGDFIESVDTLHRYGFNIHGLFIFGADTDTVRSLEETVGFALQNKLYTVGFSALYDIPGKEKTLGLPQLIPDHRFIHRDWRLFTSHFVVHYPRQMRPSQLQRAIIDGQKRFFRENRATFFQYFPVYASSEPYIRYLEQAERDLYDTQDRLIEERLMGRTYEDLPDLVPLRASRWVKSRETGEFILQNAFRAKAWQMLSSNFGRRGTGAKPLILGSLQT
ncbi:B12-binding domain-containing radical SAM protein [Candidatus Fermentibacteria bacterium]|nr:B12-binding domain-containing radical SAM protein [Candidatus Fermentibacteria bacterium]